MIVNMDQIELHVIPDFLRQNKTWNKCQKKKKLGINDNYI
jgi:hypothetical protein